MDRRLPCTPRGLCGALLTGFLLAPIPVLVAESAHAAPPIGPGVRGDVSTGPEAGPQLPYDEIGGPGTVVDLPPLPTHGDEREDTGTEGSGSQVQTVALGLAGTALFSGLAGLAVVTRRGRAGTSPAPTGESPAEGSQEGTAG